MRSANSRARRWRGDCRVAIEAHEQFPYGNKGHCGLEGEEAESILDFRHYGFMAIREMTFSVPEQLAAQFTPRLLSCDRSRFVSEALAAQLEARDLQLIRACEVANGDLDALEIEKDFDGIRDAVAVP